MKNEWIFPALDVAFKLAILLPLAIFNQWVAFAAVAVCFNITALVAKFIPKQPLEVSAIDPLDYADLKSRLNAVCMTVGVRGE